MNTFIKSCKKGDENKAKKCIQSTLEDGLLCACSSGKLSTVKCVISMLTDIGFVVDVENVFSEACTYGQTEIAAYLVNTFESHKLVTVESFARACINGHIDMAKFILELDTLDVIDMADGSTWGEIFNETCSNNYIDVAKWLYLINTKLYSQELLKKTFDDMCCIGHQKIAQWIIILLHDNTSFNNSFALACENNHLHLVKLLWYIDSNITITDDIFECSCKNGNIEIILWFYEIHFNPTSHRSLTNGYKVSCDSYNFEVSHWLIKTYPELDTRENTLYCQSKKADSAWCGGGCALNY